MSIENLDWEQFQRDSDAEEAWQREYLALLKASQLAEFQAVIKGNPEWTPEQQAVVQYLRKSKPTLSPCGCLGPKALDGQPKATGDNWDSIKREPRCPCAMQFIEEVSGQYYQILIHLDISGKESTYTANGIGPVGGPYTINEYGLSIGD